MKRPSILVNVSVIKLVNKIFSCYSIMCIGRRVTLRIFAVFILGWGKQIWRVKYLCLRYNFLSHGGSENLGGGDFHPLAAQLK